eukprot:scaffold337_cov393-Prasinococcus_capsulatus_cf.AAC.6
MRAGTPTGRDGRPQRPATAVTQAHTRSGNRCRCSRWPDAPGLGGTGEGGSKPPDSHGLAHSFVGRSV